MRLPCASYATFFVMTRLCCRVSRSFVEASSGFMSTTHTSEIRPRLPRWRQAGWLSKTSTLKPARSLIGLEHMDVDKLGLFDWGNGSILYEPDSSRTPAELCD